MATYEITAPTGDVFEVTAPDGATEDQVLSYARQHFAAQNPEGIGHDVKDTRTVAKGGRRMTDDQMLTTLRAQVTDPHRDPGSDAELQREIARMERAQGGPVTPASAPVAPPAFDVSPQPPRAAQADVRRLDTPSELPMEAQGRREGDFQQKWRDWIMAGSPRRATKFGEPAPTDAEAVADWSGTPNPSGTRKQAQLEHFAQTGDLQYMNTDIEVTKGLAAMAGFMRGGPGGATAAEAAVRAATLALHIKDAMDAGLMDDEDARALFNKEFGTGVAKDAAWNYGLLLLPKAVAWLGGTVGSKIPGMKAVAELLQDKAMPVLQRMAASATQAVKDTGAGKAVAAVAEDWRAGAQPGATAPTLRDTKIAKRQALTDNPDRKEAVEELSRRTQAAGKDIIPSPGQVSDTAGTWETNVRRGAQAQFNEADKALEKSASDMLYETTTPDSQMTRETLGRKIQAIGDRTQAAMKDRLRPVFERADNLGVKVDLSKVREIAQETLDEGKRVPGHALNDKERVELQRIVDDLTPRIGEEGQILGPKIGAEHALDFMSRRKEVLRNTTNDWTPSQRFTAVTDRMIDAADDAYGAAARSIGRADVTRDLYRANGEYRETMSTIYKEAVRDALKKAPQDVGRIFWQNGNTSELRQFYKLLDLSMKEGTLGAAGAEKMKRDVARGFLQDGMKNLDAAANWSQRLKENVPLRETWDLISSGADGQALRHAVDVIEQAAQVALKNNMAIAGSPMQAITRATSGGAGVTYTAGHINVPVMIAGLSLTGIVKMAATAYTTGERGILNSIAKVARLQSVGTAAAVTAAKAEAEKLSAWARKNDIDPEEQEQEQSQQSQPGMLGVNGTPQPNPNPAQTPTSSAGVRG